MLSDLEEKGFGWPLAKNAWRGARVSHTPSHLLPVALWLGVEADIPDGHPWWEKLNAVSAYGSDKKLINAADIEFLKSFHLQA